MQHHCTFAASGAGYITDVFRSRGHLNKDTMSIKSEGDLEGLKGVSDAVAVTLNAMRQYARPGMTTKVLGNDLSTLTVSYSIHYLSCHEN